MQKFGEFLYQKGEMDLKKNIMSIVLALIMCLTICPVAKAERTSGFEYSFFGTNFSNSIKIGEYGGYFHPADAAGGYVATTTSIRFASPAATVTRFYQAGTDAESTKQINGTIFLSGQALGTINYTNSAYPEYYYESKYDPVNMNIYTINGLTPNTKYPISASFTWNYLRYDDGDRFDIVQNCGTTYSYSAYTEATVPIISFSGIKDKQVTINWNPNGNPAGTSYTLDRKIGNGPWSTVVDKYTGNTYTDTNLVEETAYIYRLRVNHVAGVDWNVYTPEQSVTTTANPAVAAAQEAASAAQAAKLAAESSTFITIEAKDAAVSAEAKSQQVYDLVNNLNLGSIKTDITNMKSMMGASIEKVYTTNRATAVKGTAVSPPIAIESTGITHFQLSLDGINWSVPVGENFSASISGLTDGYNTIRVRGYNANIPESERTYINKQIGIFKIK